MFKFKNRSCLALIAQQMDVNSISHCTETPAILFVCARKKYVIDAEAE